MKRGGRNEECLSSSQTSFELEGVLEVVNKPRDHRQLAGEPVGVIGDVGRWFVKDSLWDLVAKDGLLAAFDACVVAVNDSDSVLVVFHKGEFENFPLTISYPER